MNHLRELLELHPSEWLVDSALSDDDAYLIATEVHRNSPQAVCFSLGDVSTYTDLKEISQLAVLPYDCCWFEFTAEGEDASHHVFGCMVYREERGIKMIIFSKRNSQWWLSCGVLMEHWINLRGVGAGLVARVIPNQKYCGEIALDCLAIIGRFLTAMSCKNVQKACVTPSEKLQKARQKRGKKPLFSYWVLELNGKKDPSAPLGGTHASPRLHLRRGHPREYAPGKWTWVTESIVGNKSMGMIHKDYSAGKSLTDNARKALQAA